MRIQESLFGEPPSVPDRHGENVGEALTHGLNLPLAALRASIVTLSSELSRRDVGQTYIRGVLEEVDRLGRNVEDLLDFARPVSPYPIACSVEEIVYGARNVLPPERREAVLFARPEETRAIHVDGPLLTQTIRRLIENALETGSDPVLVRSVHSKEGTSFVVVDAGSGSFDPGWGREAFHTTKANHLGLGLALAHRDLALMGGWLEVMRTPSGHTCATVTVPDRSDVATGEEGGR